MSNRFRKYLLPVHDVFDEDRYFESTSGPQTMELVGKMLRVTICEDI